MRVQWELGAKGLACQGLGVPHAENTSCGGGEGASSLSQVFLKHLRSCLSLSVASQVGTCEMLEPASYPPAACLTLQMWDADGP